MDLRQIQAVNIMKYRINLVTTSLLCGIILGGCASKVPEYIRNAPAGDIRVDEVQQEATRFVENEVRWGGSIISVQNLSDETHIEVLAVNLSKSGKPQDDAKSSGRFIARIKGFLEPEEYPKDRLLTVTGTVKDVVKQPVGSYPYPYPVVEVKGYYLWPEDVYYSPHHYDPFYNPYFYPHPYWRRYPYYW
ncbi:MAG: Slp family lipoprotein [Candidatus Thiodiazotropha sp. (ex Monitilora ramsayi)]|nr:Slp family lipoprotein [Candidatus Thiodiazotropha sp. (ex Monitilora ramsayi)]